MVSDPPRRTACEPLYNMEIAFNSAAGLENGGGGRSAMSSAQRLSDFTCGALFARGA